MNKTFAVFANGGTMTTAQTALWQYDYGQILVIQGVELPTAYEVQFCNAGDSTTITSVGDSTGVVIPDQFLQNGETIYAYIYLHTGNADGETEYKITIPVMDRAEPTDIEPTPQQESTIGQLIDALNAGVEAAEEAAEKGPQIIDGYWHTWDAETGGYVNTNVKAEGEDGEPGTPGADGNSIWWTVSLINDESMAGLVLGKIRSSWLKGRTGTPAVHDLVVGPAVGTFGSIVWLYEIISVAGIYCNLKGIGSIKGAPGEPGDDGYSPVVTITEIEGGHRVTITDEAHPDGQSFDVMDGTGGSGTVDDDFSTTSENPVQNKVITNAFNYASQQLTNLGLALDDKVDKVSGKGLSTNDFTDNDKDKLDDAASKTWVQQQGYLTGVDLADYRTAAQQNTIDDAQDAAIAAKYTKPSGGIPATDLAAAVQTSLGKADTALQSAPVSSVNGQTGAVSLSIPSTAADVGAIAAPANPSSAQDLVYLNGAWVAADKLYIVNLTPIATDFSGTMDKTVAEIYAAYQAGKTIVFRVWASASEFADVTATMVGTNDNYNYPSFNAFIIMDAYNVIVYAYTSTTDNGSKATYHTFVYPLSTSACIPAPATPTTGDFLCWNGSSWAATSLSTWQGGNYGS